MQQFKLEFRGQTHLKSLEQIADAGALARLCKDDLHEALIRSITGVFEAEGIPEWPPLAELTIVRRRLLGFAAGPILQRTGELLRSLTEPSSRHHVFEVSLGKNHATITIGTSLPKAIPLGRGDEETNLPPRPMFPPERLIHAELEGVIINAGRAI